MRGKGLKTLVEIKWMKEKGLITLIEMNEGKRDNDFEIWENERKRD